MNGGQCIVPDTCMCKRGFTGDMCQFRDQSQDSNPIMSTILDDGRSRRHSSVCSVYGLHHYTTLDGAKYFFPGECTYSMVAQKGGTFHVMVGVRVFNN